MSTKPNIVIIGGGNQAQYVIDIIEKQEFYNIVGIIDSVKEIGTVVYGYAVIGRQEDIYELMQKYYIIGGVIAIGDNYARYKVVEEIKTQVGRLFWFVNAIHPSCIVGKNVNFGEGVVAMAGVIFNPGAVVGSFTFFATGAQIEHDCFIEDYASVSAGTVLGGHVHINAFAALALSVTVFDRTKIGTNTVIGSGSLVTKDVPSNVLAYGNPLKIIRSRELGERFLK